MTRRIVLLTWGHSDPRTAKTATGLLRWCADECVAVFDPDNAGGDTEVLLGVGKGTPIIGQLDEASNANTLAIGIAPPGGKIPIAWKPVLLEAISRGMTILSGLHDFLSDDPDLVAAAEKAKVELIDVRKNNFREIATRRSLNDSCCRIHTVGQDCGVGKMLVSLQVARGLQSKGIDAHFIATGQTGIMISGEGLPIDCVVADFVSGAAESLVVANQHHDVIVVEGQGSLAHPAYSAVTLGLLHGTQPHGLIFVFDASRQGVGGLEHVELPPIEAQIRLFESMGSIYQPCRVFAIAMNGSKLSNALANQYAEELENQLGLPVVDTVRDGPDKLLRATEEFIMKWRNNS